MGLDGNREGGREGEDEPIAGAEKGDGGGGGEVRVPEPARARRPDALTWTGVT